MDYTQTIFNGCLWALDASKWRWDCVVCSVNG